MENRRATEMRRRAARERKMQQRLAQLNCATAVEFKGPSQQWAGKSARAYWSDGAHVWCRYTHDNIHWGWEGTASWSEDAIHHSIPCDEADVWYRAIAGEVCQRVTTAYLGGFAPGRPMTPVEETARKFGINAEALREGASEWANRHFLSAAMYVVARPSDDWHKPFAVKGLAAARKRVADLYGVEPFVEVDEYDLDDMSDEELEALKSASPKSDYEEALDLLVRRLGMIRSREWFWFGQEVGEDVYRRAMEIAERAAAAREAVV